jgi:molybdopterin converting factor small subunit
MKLKVELQAYLDQYAPGVDPTFDYEMVDGATVRDVVEKLGIPAELAGVIVVSDAATGPDHVLRDGDRVTLLPPLAGG